MTLLGFGTVRMTPEVKLDDGLSQIEWQKPQHLEQQQQQQQWLCGWCSVVEDVQQIRGALQPLVKRCCLVKGAAASLLF